MKSNKVIEIQHLSYHYPDGTPALKDIDLEVYQHEAVAMLGPNGAGKSTLLYHLNGTLSGEGKIIVLGLPVEKKNGAAQQPVACCSGSGTGQPVTGRPAVGRRIQRRHQQCRGQPQYRQRQRQSHRRCGFHQGGKHGCGAGGRGAAAQFRTRTGTADEEIQIVFDKYKATLYRMYNAELRKNPTLRGKVLLRITIEPGGEVSACSVQSSDLASPELVAQIVERVKKFNFGPKEKVSKTTILYPIDFLPGG